MMGASSRSRVSRRSKGLITAVIIVAVAIVAAAVIDGQSASFPIQAIPALLALAVFPVIAFTWPKQLQ